MVTLKEKNSNRWIGSMSFAQLKFLNEELKEDHKNDQDYRISRATLSALKERGMGAEITTIIEKAMSDKDVLEFYWIKS
ncbi:MAG: hypothetical protein U1C48_10075 [Methylotenera sp.]|jgi:hypothetical protein|nr:hypothetical protein [Methylotenera sp.]PKO51871.1 MAG: hypothetical protein CVU27_05180 [Betaproteobacteria bacterium HGW-Betaproteobacteria-20]